jgi:hypothetical protein
VELGLRVAFVEPPGAFQRYFICPYFLGGPGVACFLVECDEVCQYYFSIFETADSIDGVDNTVLWRALKGARERVCPPKKQGTRELPREFPITF